MMRLLRAYFQQRTWRSIPNCYTNWSGARYSSGLRAANMIGMDWTGLERRGQVYLKPHKLIQPGN